MSRRELVPFLMDRDVGFLIFVLVVKWSSLLNDSLPQDVNAFLGKWSGGSWTVLHLLVIWRSKQVTAAWS
jgi:hypothetical protein